MQFAVMIASHNEHNISENQDYASLSKCLDYALRHSKFMKKPMFTRCVSIPLKTLLYGCNVTSKRRIFVIKEEDFQVFTNPNLGHVQGLFVCSFQRIELVADVAVSAQQNLFSMFLYSKVHYEAEQNN
ncbi:Uncharacterised protein [Acinetobacter baumannii]|nr:hypothetical protein F922_03373 [Acinetobacter baumannii NIPH 201]SSP11768.1 Uncharacterised protein [Acinetobacter baumannii]ENW33569.1 hypothetical protein F922_03362 [Acinetobacter baumannii NIPH 201]ENW35470.1 hypothetical protein F922_01336 [Acinetobacter baumannii NIPH 201]ENW36884.1 hypothetical protein F922_01325 [Acinetobacter baumannii NIPH 201]